MWAAGPLPQALLVALIVLAVFLVAEASPPHFLPGFPRVVPGSETEAMTVLAYRVSKPANVTCVGLNFTDGVTEPPPTLLLFVEPYEAGVDPADGDPARHRLLHRSLVNHAWDTSQLHTTFLFIPPGLTRLRRRVHVWCAAVSNANFGPGSGDASAAATTAGPITTHLSSFDGVFEWQYTPSQLALFSLVPTSLFNDFVQLSGESSNTLLMDVPTEVSSFQDVSVLLRTSVDVVHAQQSTYFYGITDGATTWLVSISRSSVQVFQERFRPLVIAGFGTTSNDFPPVSGFDETSQNIELRFIVTRRTNLVDVRVSRGDLQLDFTLEPVALARAIAGPLRVVAYSRLSHERYSFGDTYIRVVSASGERLLRVVLL